MTKRMTKTEILDKVIFGYDVKVPDVLSSLDFDEVEIEESKPASVKRKYVSAAVIYAAACLVVVLILPFIIGDGVGYPKPNPNPNPGVNMTGTETSPDDTPKTYPAPEVNIADEVPEEYYGVLVRYRSAVEAVVTGKIIEVDGSMGSPYEPVHAFSAGMCEAGLAMDDRTAFKYGYSLKDMDGDGTPELLLITENHVLLELYSIVDGEVKLLEYFRPRYTGVVLAANSLYTHGSGGVGVNIYTGSKYDGQGSLVPYLEFGSDVSDDGQYYYKAKDGGEREIISEEDFMELKDRYPEIPVFSGEDNVLDLDVKYYSIAPTVKDRFIAALKSAIADGTIGDMDFEDEDITCVTDPYANDSDISVLTITKGYPTNVFLYSNNVISHFAVELPVYVIGNVQYCDVDKNGKEDLLIYGGWGSGVAGYSLIYFDTNTNTATELCGVPFAPVRVVEELGDDGEVRYCVYTGLFEGEGVYLGTLEYENGHIVTDLIYEGSLSEVVVMLMRGIPEETEATNAEPPEVVTSPKETEAPETTPKVTETSETTIPKETEPPVTTPAETEPPKHMITDPVITNQSITSVTKVFCGLEYTMTVDKESYKSSDTLTVTVTLENKGDHDVGLCSYDYRVEDNYLDDIVFYEGEVDKSHGNLHIVTYNMFRADVIKPGEKTEFTEMFDLSEMDESSEWSVKSLLNYVPDPPENFREEFFNGTLDDKIKNVSLEIDIRHEPTVLEKSTGVQ